MTTILNGKMIDLKPFTDSILFIGDSYTEAISLHDNSKRFSKLVSDMLGLKQLNYGIGGTGFASGHSNNTRYLNQLQNAYNDTSFNNDRVRYVIISGGRNDAYGGPNYSFDTIYTYVHETVSYSIEHFVNAQTIVIPMFYDYKWIPDAHYKWYLGIINGCLTLPCIILYDAFTMLTGYKDYILSDNVHPNEYGHKLIADYIVRAIKSNDCNLVHTNNKYQIGNNIITLTENTIECYINTTQNYNANDIIAQTTINTLHCECYIPELIFKVISNNNNIYNIKITTTFNTNDTTIKIITLSNISNDTISYKYIYPFARNIMEV